MAIAIGLMLSLSAIVLIGACIHTVRRRMPVEAVLSGLIAATTLPAAVFQLMAIPWAQKYVAYVLMFYVFSSAIIVFISAVDRQADGFWFGAFLTAVCGYAAHLVWPA